MEQRQIPSEILEKITQEYEAQKIDRMGRLHEQFVAFISESKLPFTEVALVLQMLLNENMELAKKKYLGE